MAVVAISFPGYQVVGTRLEVVVEFVTIFLIVNIIHKNELLLIAFTNPQNVIERKTIMSDIRIKFLCRYDQISSPNFIAKFHHQISSSVLSE